MATTPTGPQPWSRARLLTLLAVGAATFAAALVGLGAAVVIAVRPGIPLAVPPAGGGGTPPGTTAPTGPRGGDGALAGPVVAAARRDALAAAPMLHVPPDAAQPAALSSTDPGHLDLPAATTYGPVGVPSGFPHTPVGAVAQLAALDALVLSRADLDTARQVITAWALPGGPTPTSWSAVKALAGFHSAAGTAGPGAVAVQATALAGQVKAVDGPDWVIACVLFEVDATAARTARVGAADCQRMQWTPPGVWRIAPGAEPAPAPSTWPGTAVAAAAGWKTLRWTPTRPDPGAATGGPS